MVPGVGPRTRTKLLERFGSPEAVLTQRRATCARCRESAPSYARRFAVRTKKSMPKPRWNYAVARRSTSFSTPTNVIRAPADLPDPPGVLFVRGNLPQRCDGRSNRRLAPCHALWFDAGGTVGRQLARAGLTVVSGLARGIDAAAHRGALAAGGRTIAVLASGVLNIYPPEHDESGRGSGSRGAVISESPPRRAIGRDVSAAESNHQRAVAGRAGGGSLDAIRRVDHRAPCDGARARCIRRARSGRPAACRTVAIA